MGHLLIVALDISTMSSSLRMNHRTRSNEYNLDSRSVFESARTTDQLYLFLILDFAFRILSIYLHFFSIPQQVVVFLVRLFSRIASSLNHYQIISFMAATNRDSIFDEIDRLLDDEEFCLQLQRLHEESCKTRTFDTNL